MKKLLFKQFLHLLFIIILIPQIYSQKVGLVLSGGGPRGVTHVGILKALEEHNIPIHYITGTSMGAIVGGLYAAGYSPEEIERLITSENMLEWISSPNEEKYRYYFKQADPNASWQIFKITYDTVFSAKLPTNIISPFEMDFGFLELFSGASAASNYNFDSLFIPFRCVASDIAENKPLILKDGQLEKAIRASMTFPFYFKPIKIDGKLLFDGGMYNNFPIDVMEDEFNPDIIIGCKAASNYGPPEDDDLISQIQSMLMANTDYEVDPSHGVLIEPQLKTVNVTDFSNTQKFIDSGYVAAVRKMKDIKELIQIRETKKQKDFKRNAFRSKIPTLRIGDIEALGISPKQEIYINRLIKKDKLIKKLDDSTFSNEQVINKLKYQYFRIVAEEQIESVHPELIYYRNKAYYDLIFDIKKGNMVEAEVGGLVSSTAVNEIFLQLQYNHWGKRAFSLTGNTYIGRFHNSGHFRARMDFPGNFPFALEAAYTLNSWNYSKTSTYFFGDENPSYLIQKDNYFNFNFSMPITQYGKVTTQYSAGTKKDEYYQTNQFTRLDTTDQTTFKFHSPGILFELNSLNRKQFASSGVLFRADLRYITGLEENFPGSTSVDTSKNYHNWIQFRFIYDNYFHKAGPLKFGFYGQLTLSNQPTFSNYTSTVLASPSFEPVPESQIIFLPQFRAFNFAAMGLKIVVDIYRNLEFRTEGYGFQPFQEILKTEDNKATFGEDFSNRYFIGSGSFVYHAPFGPISMCLNYFESAEQPWSFSINIGYFIFNKRPFH